MRNSILFLPLAVLFFACGGNSVTQNSDAKKKILATDSPANLNANRKFNDYARYIAGLSLADGHGIGNLKADSAFQQHCSMMDSRWTEMENNRLTKMRKFADTELYLRLDKNANLFYPFSGADFLHASTFFPNAKKSLYMALEQVGEVPEITAMDDKKRKGYLHSIEATLSDIFRRSYFITRQMGRDIPQVKGVIPVFMVFIVRQGFEILNIEKTELNERGETVAFSGKPGKMAGMRITYCPAQNKSDKRVLEYFSGDVSNDALAKNPEILMHLKAFGPANLFFKAASYLMHNPYMSDFRNASISICKAVVQDDTGFPYRVLKDNYEPYLYGKYVKPIRDFGKGGYQPDLAKLYKESSTVKTLPFSLGYHWWDNNQNYMCFVRKGK